MTQGVMVCFLVVHETGESFRLWEIKPESQKLLLVHITTPWEHTRNPALHLPHTVGSPIRSLSGISCSGPELTGWRRNAVRSPQTRRCVGNWSNWGTTLGLASPGLAGTATGLREDVTLCCHGNSESDAMVKRLRQVEVRARCHPRWFWS